MGKTISEKILATASNQESVKAGDFVKAKVDVALNHDVTSVLAFEAMKAMGSEWVWNPDKVVIILDHVAPPSSVNSARVHNIIRDFAREQQINHFYDSYRISCSVFHYWHIYCSFQSLINCWNYNSSQQNLFFFLRKP